MTHREIKLGQEIIPWKLVSKMMAALRNKKKKTLLVSELSVEPEKRGKSRLAVA